MASSPFELTLGCKPHSFDSQIDHKLKLEDFLSRLEEERIKIDAFKRELPICMQLLTNALEASRHQLQANRPVLEEFMPLNNLTSENIDMSQNMSDHKASWMTTAQLWSQEGNETKPQSLVSDTGLNAGPKLGLDTITKKGNGGSFLPFSKDRECSEAVPDLSLSFLNKDMEDGKCNSESENGVICQRKEEVGTGQADGKTTNTNTNQVHRKARRCWSPDLHRRFVNALQMLGGSQVATPKQIRELMKVDGLTNDEVKSHLQKYRLHTSTPSPSPQAAGVPAPQLVVLGGIWVPPEYASAAHSGGTALYGAHHVPPHFCAPAMPQEFYRSAVGVAANPALPPPQRHPQYYNMYKASTRSRSSAEPDIREDGDRSESSSWKGDSGGDHRTGLSALREEGEESNRCLITLKF